MTDTPLWGVLRAPHDPTPYRVYADWLRERGREAEAELIECHVDLDEVPLCAGTVSDEEVPYQPAAVHVASRPAGTAPGRRARRADSGMPSAFANGRLLRPPASRPGCVS